MMIRSPQHNTKADQENTWSFYVGSKLVEQSVAPESHAALLSFDPTTQQKKLEELYYKMQAAATTQERPLMSPTIGLGQSTPLRGAVAEGRDGGWGTGATHSQTTPIIGSGDERRGFGAAEQEPIIPTRLFASPPPQGDELENIRSRLENLSTSIRQSAAEHHDALNWTYTAQEHEQYEEEQKACANRKHEFEQRAKQYLSLPAKRFTAAYNSCIFHFKRNVNTLISKELISELMDELEKQYQETSKARDYCMEVLSQEDLNFNSKYEDYMKIKLDQFNECRRLKDQYVIIHQQELQLPQRSLQAEVGHQARHHGPDSTGTIPKVPQLNKELLSNVQEGKRTLESITPISKYHQPSSHSNQHHEQGTGGHQHSNQHHEQGTGENQHHEQGTGGHQQSNQQQERDTRRSQRSNRHSTQNEHGTEAGETQNQGRNGDQNEEHHRRRFFRETNEENLNTSMSFFLLSNWFMGGWAN